MDMLIPLRPSGSAGSSIIINWAQRCLAWVCLASATIVSGKSALRLEFTVIIIPPVELLLFLVDFVILYLTVLLPLCSCYCMQFYQGMGVDAYGVDCCAGERRGIRSHGENKEEYILFIMNEFRQVHVLYVTFLMTVFGSFIAARRFKILY